MNIGAKIKELRTGKMMTQAELAGDLITRNMLSRIENGFATPSVQTLAYLASRLGVPAGSLLAEENEEFYYRKAAQMPDIIRAFTAGDWQICSDLCRRLQGKDSEISLLVALCGFNSARDEFYAGNLRSALRDFEQVINSCSETVYPTDEIMNRSLAYIICITDISPSFDTLSDLPSSIPEASGGDIFCAYYRRYKNEEKEELPKDKNGSKVFVNHLAAKKSVEQGHYGEALSLLRSILSSPEPVAAPMLYFVFSDMERCSRELGDFKAAYEYASVRTSMLERFLRQTARTDV